MTQKYADADSIITYLTPNKGIIKAFAKSSRKIKSRFGSSLEPLTHSKITLLGKEHSMPRIIQSDIIKSFHGLRENFQDFINISRLIEIFVALTPEGAPNKNLFLFFLNIMTLIESLDEKHKAVLYLISQIHLLALLGYAPRLSGCGKCGFNSFDFYPDSGTTLCKKCAASQSRNRTAPLKITSKIIKFYSHSIGWPVHASTRLRPSRETISVLSALLEKHLNHLLDKRLMSSEFLAGV